MALLRPVESGKSELSPLLAGQLVIALQESPAVQQMVQLKILDWNDLEYVCQSTFCLPSVTRGIRPYAPYHHLAPTYYRNL